MATDGPSYETPRAALVSTSRPKPGTSHRPGQKPPSAQHKMMHFEVQVDDLEAAIDAVIDAGGATATHQPRDRDPSRIRVMLDPAGHPFCLFVAGE